jgi:hypothetical protein
MAKAELIFGLTCFLAAGHAWADEANGSPFFRTFKTICADTRAEPEAVIKAVSAAGGLANGQIKDGDTTGAGWRVTVDGRTMIVSSSAGKTADGPGRERQTIDCEITSLNDERSNLTAFAAWAGGVGKDVSSAKTSYVFQERRGVHIAMVSARTHEEHWVLAVFPGVHATTVQLIHVMAAAR